MRWKTRMQGNVLCGSDSMKNAEGVECFAAAKFICWQKLLAKTSSWKNWIGNSAGKNTQY